MYKRIFLLFSLILVVSTNTYCQTGFYFKNQTKSKQKISFKEVNNLIVIPLIINGKKMSFILDTGVNKTILFNLSDNDSLKLLNTRKVSLKGLGGGDAVDAIISSRNKIELKGLVSNSETIFVVLKDFFDLSGKMGRTIHGIIGYSLFKNFIVNINYNTKRIEFHNPEKFKYRNCKKCFSTPLYFFKNKPFIKAKVSLDTIGSKLTEVTMLIDTGGSDALWLFEKSKKEIQTPKRFFNDILGEGLSGTIYGNRSRIPEFILGRFKFKKPTVSFLDSISTVNARKFKDRNGSIGGGILNRFKIWIDYPNKKITFKKNSSLKDGFNYNMSGLDIVYSGKEVIKEKILNRVNSIFNQERDDANTISFVTSYTYKFKPSYKINKVVENSPAHKAGLKPNDKLLKLNGKLIHNFNLSDIIYKFQQRPGKKIRMIILRNGEEMKFEFQLEKKV